MRSLILLLAMAPTMLNAAELDVWVGTATASGGPTDKNPSRGIYHLTLDDTTGELSTPTLAAETQQPGFLAMHPSLPVLYSTLDSSDGAGVAAWRILNEGGVTRLEAINSEPTGDGGPCHVSVDKTGRVLLSTQYGGGSVASYRLNEDGSIAGRASLIEHDEPSGVVPGTQAACHPHWAGVSPDNRFVLVTDLGADRVYVYGLDTETGALSKHGSVKTRPGGGPRHFAFHPSGAAGYVVNELDLSLSALGYDQEAGELTLLSTADTLTKQQREHERTNSGSEVRMHPSGKFVYSANRGHDSISVFSVDDSFSELSLQRNEPVRGAWPRNFNLDPSGRWLLAAGRDSQTLAVFAIDSESGDLQYARRIAQVPSPICVLVEPRRAGAE